MRNDILKQLYEASSMLELFIKDDEQLKNIGIAADLIIKCFRSGGKLIVAGNGGSMSDAIHFAAELMGKYRDARKPLPVITISDPAYLTCVSNDLGYKYVFSRSIMALAKPEDTILLITTSGNSENVFMGALAGDYHIGCNVIFLTSEKAPDPIVSFSTVAIKVPKSEHADRIQELHIKILHILVWLIENEMKNEL